MKIDRIVAEAFRGIAHSRTILLEGKSLVIFGDNGTGKSSFVEAVECALTGNVRSLGSKGQRVSFKKHSTHVNFSEKDRKALVSLRYKGKVYGPSCVPFKDCGLPPDASEFLASALNGTFVLRRSALLLFVEATDKDRYNIVKPFLNIERYEEFEAALKEVKAQTQAEYSSVMAKLDSTKQILGQRFGLSMDQVLEAKLREILQAEAVGISTKPIETLADVEELRKVLQSRISQRGVFATAARTLVADMLAIVPAKDACDKLLDLISDRFRNESANSRRFVEKVLELGSNWIASDNLQECPLCEQPIEKEIVLSAIRARLESNKELAESRRKCEEMNSLICSNLEQMISKASNLERAWSDVLTVNESNPIGPLISTCTELLFLLRKTEYWRLFETIKGEFEKLFSKPIQTIQGEADELLGWTPDSKDESSFALLEKCNSYINTVPTIYSHIADVKEKGRVNELASGLYEQAVEIRKKECARIFREICLDIKVIYDRFHPDEPLGDFSLEVKDKGEGSAVLLGSFAERTEEDPRAYYSEAHQDTLGLAIFLSLHDRAVKGSAFSLLVLDDILTSVDASHRGRVADYLLDKVGSGMQLIITTHSRQWFEWLLQIESAKGLKDKFVNKRIIDWSLENGPILEDPEGDYQSLKAGIGQKAHEQLLPIAGRLLEEILHNMRFGLSIAVSARPGDKYTIGDLFPPFVRKLKDFPALKAKVETVCNELNNTSAVRNWTIHYNDWATELSSGEAKQFMQQVMKLYELTHCEGCGTFVSKSDTDAGTVKCRKSCKVYEIKPVVKTET